MSIVDTPGTNAVVRGHEALTRDFVPRSDLVLFVTSADRPFTESERAFLEAIRDWGKKVVVAVNKTDILDRPADVDKVVEFVQDKLRERLALRPEVFAVSARRAQKAKAAGASPDPRTTGFGALEAYLTRTLDEAERLRLKLLSPVGVALRALDGVAAAARERLSVVEADEAALREIDSQLVLHLQEQSREFRLRLADGRETPGRAREARGVVPGEDAPPRASPRPVRPPGDGRRLPAGSVRRARDRGRPKIIEAHVTLGVEKYRHWAEVVLICSNHITIEAREETDDLYVAIDAVMDKIARQMRKYKTRLLRRHRPRKEDIRHIEEQILHPEPVEEDEHHEHTVVRTERHRSSRCSSTKPSCNWRCRPVSSLFS